MKIENRILVIAAFGVFLLSCKLDKVSMEAYSKGIEISANGIKAEQVYVTDGDKGIKSRQFKYAQKIFTNFEGISGFTVHEGKYYPEMEVLVVSKRGDTVFRQKNLFPKDTSFEVAQTALHGHLILANPMRSGEEYTAHYTLYDTKGKGSLNSAMDFVIVRDDHILVTPNGLDFNEAYLFSKTTEKALAEGKLYFDEESWMDFQGLRGYRIREGRASLGLSVLVTDDNGRAIVRQKDIFEGQTLDVQQLKAGVASTLHIGKGSLANPVRWKVRIWDKNSAAELNAEAILEVVE
ncbi:MAG: hypothetical protein AAFX53_04820 [Bacteroidota bacterium]